MRGYTFAAIAIAIGVAEPAEAACPSADMVTAYAASWLTNSPAKSFGPGLSLEEGYCAQKLLVEKLTTSLGPKVGYKAAATNKKIQEALKLDGPLHGVPIERMLLKDGAEVSASEPYVFESDLLLRVKDKGVNSAKEPIEALKSISEAVPFIELPSSPGHLAKGETFDGPNIAAMNAVARRGILGEPIPLNPTQGTVDALGKMEVVLLDDTGKEYARAAGSAVMGHPLAVVMWLAEELRKSGDRLKPGDLISVGSFSPLTPPVAGLTVTARYHGLADRVGQVSVKFK